MEIKEIEGKVISHETRIGVLEKRIDRIEMLSDSVNKLNVNIERLTGAVDNIVDIQKEQKKVIEQQAQDITELKLQPGRDAKAMWRKVFEVILTVVVTAIVTALITIVIKK